MRLVFERPVGFLKRDSMLTLKKAQDWMQAKLLNAKGREDTIFTGISTDSRTLQKGDLYVAILGEKFNGHDFLKEAEMKGASAAIVSDSLVASNTTLPCLLVEDTVLALGFLARQYRAQFQIPIAAITGSCGKTSVKEMLARILSRRGPVLATRGNLNTEIGVPLSLLALNESHIAAVIEMGARKTGDIAYLMDIVKPTVSILTNAGVAHVEIFGSTEEIAKTKGEIFTHLAVNGIAIINQDDKYAQYWKGLLKNQQCITFGFSKEANIHCENVEFLPEGSRFEVKTPKGAINLVLKVAGKHNVENALCALSAALSMGASLDDIKQGLASFEPVAGRMQFKEGRRGIKIIDDTYNANPVSMRAALEVLSTYQGKKIFVMGDMLELGILSQDFHQNIGQAAKDLHIDLLLGIGNLTEFAVKAFGKGAKHFASKVDLLNTLATALPAESKEEITILVKGSRGMRMEEIVNALLKLENKSC